MVGRKGPRGCTAPFADLSPDKVEDLDVGEVSWAAEAVASSWQAAANHVESLGDADMDEMDLDVDEQLQSDPVPASPVPSSAQYSPSEFGEVAAPLQQQLCAAAAAFCTEAEVRAVVRDEQRVLVKGPLNDTITRSIAWVAQHYQEQNAMDRLGSEMLHNKSHRTTSILELADKVGANRRKLPQNLKLIAAAVVESERAQRSSFEQRVVMGIPKDDLLLYVDNSTYDETPMPIVAKDIVSSDAELESISTALELADKPCSPGVVAMPPLPREQYQSGKLSAKLFQSDQSYVMLVRLRDRNAFAVFEGNTINWLQRLEGTDAKSIQNALHRVSAVSEAANEFETKIRIAGTDDASANQLCETNLIKDRGHNWKSSRFSCEVHKTSTCFLHTFAIIESFISGILNCSLSVNFNNYVTRFQRLTVAFIKANLIFRATPLSAAAKTYKMHVLRTDPNRPVGGEFKGAHWKARGRARSSGFLDYLIARGEPVAPISPPGPSSPSTGLPLVTLEFPPASLS